MIHGGAAVAAGVSQGRLTTYKLDCTNVRTIDCTNVRTIDCTNVRTNYAKFVVCGFQCHCVRCKVSFTSEKNSLYMT